MRTTLKAIAVVQTALGGSVLVAGMMFCVLAFVSKTNLALSLLVSLLTAVLGGVVLAGAWRHIRHPSKHTAHDIAVSTAVLVWMFVTVPMVKYVRVWTASLGIANDALASLATLVLPYLLYRVVLKRIAHAAFRDERNISDVPGPKSDAVR